jgi:maleylacetoacetate isomerase
MTNLPFKALHLYHAQLSGSSARVRILAQLKSIPLTLHNIDISSSQQHSAAYLHKNPNGTVPSLHVQSHSNSSSSTDDFTITQSLAIVDFLNHQFPSPSLLPTDLRARAQVLDLVSLVACDIQPPQSSRVRKKIVEDYNGDGEALARWVYERGFKACEALLQTRGEFCFGYC